MFLEERHVQPLSTSLNSILILDVTYVYILIALWFPLGHVKEEGR